MPKDIFRDYAVSDELTRVPDPLWRQLRESLKQRIRRERKKRGIADAGPVAGWDSIMDQDRHVIDPPRPRDVPDFITPEDFAGTVDHIARAERAFEIYESAKSPENISLDDIKHDIEAAVIGAAAWDDEEFGLAWDAFSRLGEFGEVDQYLPYDLVLLLVFDTSDSLPDHPSPEKLVQRLVNRAQAESPVLADDIRSVWGGYMILHEKRKDGEKLFREIIKRNPQDAKYHLRLAVSLEQVGDDRKAIKSIESALEIASDQGDLSIAALALDYLVRLGVLTEDEAAEMIAEACDFDDLEDEDEDYEVEDALVRQAMIDHPEYAAFIKKHGRDAEMDGMSPMMHLTMHATVERMLMDEDFGELRFVLAKLTSEGMPRHDAIHLLATPLAEMMFEVMQEKKPFDEEVYLRRVRKLLR